MKSVMEVRQKVRVDEGRPQGRALTMTRFPTRGGAVIIVRVYPCGRPLSTHML